MAKMSKPKADRKPVSVTEEIRQAPPASSDVQYRAFPERDARPGEGTVWRVRFDSQGDSKASLGLDINGDVVLGRGTGPPDLLDLSAYGQELGVSRRHAMLRPTDTHLFVVDLGSTNGTWCNGRSIGVNTPHKLTSGDTLALGRMQFGVSIIKRPTRTAALREKANLADVLMQMAKMITSQLDLREVLNHALEIAMELTSASETALWLVDERSGELFLEAECGIDDEEIRHMRIPVSDSLAGQVIASCQTLRTSKAERGESIKVKTGYMVEALVYAPLSEGSVAFGVLAAIHRQKGGMFGEQDEMILNSIADFAAIAVQNARLYEASNMALSRRIEDLAILSSALSHDLRGLLSTIVGYANLLEDTPLEDEQTICLGGITAATDRTITMVNQLLDIAVLNDSQLNFEPFDLAEAVRKAVVDMQGAALNKSIRLSYSLRGRPCLIRGDATRLYRSTLNLVDNAIKYSPEKAAIRVVLAFGKRHLFIRVRDNGPGIPEKELDNIFERYYRSAEITGEELGIGLGLTMVQATVDAHGGTVTARNLEKEGAEFLVRLPGSLRIE
jgi:signal transduction histidine kinase